MREREVTEEDRALYRQTKALEWQSGLGHDIVRVVERARTPTERITTPRCVMIVQREGIRKVRLAVLGLEDRDVAT